MIQKVELPFHMILGISDYTKIKAPERESENWITWGTDLRIK